MQDISMDPHGRCWLHSQSRKTLSSDPTAAPDQHKIHHYKMHLRLMLVPGRSARKGLQALIQTLKAALSGCRMQACSRPA